MLRLRGRFKKVSTDLLNWRQHAKNCTITPTMTATGLKTDLPDGPTVNDGKMTVEVTETLPVDASLHALATTAKTSMELTLQLPQGAGTSLMKVMREIKEVREPAAKD